MIEHKYNACPSVHRNIGEVQVLWRRLGELLQREGVDIRVLFLFYMAVIQAVLMLGSDSWVLSDTMMREVEGAHVVFLHKITWNRVRP